MIHLFLLAGLLGSGLSADPVVKVEQGLLLGALQPGAKGTASFYSFKGIPYAAPPLDSLRFKAPRPAIPWSGVRNATVEGSMCMQPTFTGQVVGSEDCLFVNVHTPKLTCDSLLPVFVFIHPSAFYFGDGGTGFYGPDFINYNGVVLVAFNYRLGPQGFLNLETPGAPGNAGLKDTLAALQWVQKNIRAFCGDPSKVTVGGNSAGAMMAHVHALSPKSQGLFQRAALISGNALTNPCYMDSHLAAARELGGLLGVSDPASLESTLRAATGEQLISAFRKMMMTEGHPNLMFKFAMSPEKPSASEGDLAGSTFLTSSPELLVRQHKVSPVPILTGNTAQESASMFHLGVISEVINGSEAAMLARVNKRFPEILQREALLIPEDIAKLLGVSRGAGGANQQEALLKLVRSEYAGGRTTLSRDEYISIVSGMVYVGPLLNYLRLCRDGEVYLYETDSVSSYNLLTRGLFQVPYATTTAHVDDLGWLFRPYSVPIQQDYHGEGLDSALLRTFTTLVTDFIKGKAVGTPAVCRESSLPFIHINGSQPVADTDYFQGKSRLWERVWDLRRKQ
ncbi:esterase FE4-like [Thrips palmi]|uniref:Esterase FE4-like n=1 Tax=Thrips palmi TaxID=161013 RepID=A0A6P8Z8Z9_THRPL|nr:esterase FE4-like [Thrips palmi]